MQYTPKEGQRMFTSGAGLLGLAASMFILAIVSRNGAAEPVSHANAALNEPEGEWPELGMRVLEPGQTMTFTMRLEGSPK